MEVLLINNQTKHLSKIQDLLKGHQVTVVSQNAIPEDYDARFDLIVLSGSSTNAVLNKKGVYQAEMDLIRDTSKPVIGICVGFELIIYAFGGTLHKLPTKVEGWQEIAPTIGNQFIVKESIVYEGHTWISNGLPMVLTGLARSDYGWELIQHKTKPIYGMQFHPEVMDAGRDGMEIFGRIVKSLMK